MEPSEGFEESSLLKVAASLHCAAQDMIRARVMNPVSEAIEVHEEQTQIGGQIAKGDPRVAGRAEGVCCLNCWSRSIRRD